MPGLNILGKCTALREAQIGAQTLTVQLSVSGAESSSTTESDPLRDDYSRSFALDAYSNTWTFSREVHRPGAVPSAGRMQIGQPCCCKCRYSLNLAPGLGGIQTGGSTFRPDVPLTGKEVGYHEDPAVDQGTRDVEGDGVFYVIFWNSSDATRSRCATGDLAPPVVNVHDAPEIVVFFNLGSILGDLIYSGPISPAVIDCTATLSVTGADITAQNNQYHFSEPELFLALRPDTCAMGGFDIRITQVVSGHTDVTETYPGEVETSQEVGDTSFTLDIRITLA